MTTKNPTTQSAPTDAQAGRLLNAEEKAVCEQVAAGDSLDSRRARALLAIDGGATQVEAGSQAGLTRGQMQYCLRTFRQQGLTIFPDAAPEPVAQPEPAPGPVSELDPTPAPEPEPVASDGGTETMVGKPRNKAGAKTGKGKKGARKKKKSGKKKKEGKKGRKSKSAKPSRKKDRKSKPGKSPRKKKRGKNDKHGAKKRNKKRKKKSKR